MTIVYRLGLRSRDEVVGCQAQPPITGRLWPTVRNKNGFVARVFRPSCERARGWAGPGHRPGCFAAPKCHCAA